MEAAELECEHHFPSAVIRLLVTQTPQTTLALLIHYKIGMMNTALAIYLTAKLTAT